MPSSLIQIILKAIDQTNSAFAKLKGDMDGLDKAAKIASVGFKAFMTPLAKISIAAAAVGIAVKKAFDLGEQGAKINSLALASSDLAKGMGGNMNEIVRAVKAASLGTISDYDAMLGASQAMMLGISTDAGEMSNLMQIATLRGRAMGITTSQAFSDIVRGIGRMSPLILDNLGIVLDADNRYKEYAASIGKAASELTKTEKKQALLNGVLEEGNDLLAKAGGLTADYSTALGRMSAEFDNWANSWKSGYAQMLAGQFLTYDERKALYKKEKQLLIESSDDWMSYARNIRAVEDGLQIAYKDRDDLMTKFQFSQAKRAIAMNAAQKESIDALVVSSGPLLNEMQMQVAFMTDLTDAQEKLNKAMEDATPEEAAVALNEYNESLEDITLKLASMAGMSTDVILGIGYAFDEIDTNLLHFLLLLESVEEAFPKDKAVQIMFAVKFKSIFGDEDLTPEEIGNEIDKWVNDTMKNATPEERIAVIIEMRGKAGIISDIEDINNETVDPKNVPMNMSEEEASLALLQGIDAYQIGDKSYTIHETKIRNTINLGDEPWMKYLAEGGPVTPGNPYIVGERGPELFVPSQAGQIIPNDLLGNPGTSGRGVGGGVNVYVTYAPMVSTASKMELENELMPIIKEGIRKATDSRIL